MSPVLLDTGVIVALLDRSEQYHDACVAIVKDLTAPQVTCEAVIAEACYLVRSLRGAAKAVLDNVKAGTFLLPFSLRESAEPVAKLMVKYRDVPMDLADACLVQLATELEIGQILTLDRDFSIYRWKKQRPFELLVPLSED
jgi:predicted nucleic acid-binding protein